MSQRFGPVKKAVTLVPLALLSTAWTASLAGVGGATLASASDGSTTLPDGTTVPTEAIEDPASYTRPGSIGLGVPKGSAEQIVSSASTNGIPSAALAAYQRAETVINAADPACNLSWQLVAAIGRVESDHGRYGGNSLGTDGVSRPGIYGIPLNGKNNTQAIRDTDAGQYDSDAKWDRAVGPMQFIPSTWSVVGVDADGDSQRNPQDIDDAALGTAVYLCSGDDDLATDAGRREAVFRYNHSDRYVDLVLSIMDAYMSGDFTQVPNSTTSAVTFTPDYDFRRPVLQPASKPGQGTATRGPQTSSGGSGSGQPAESTQEQPTETTPPPAVADNDDPVEKVKEPVKETVKNPTKPVVDLVTLAEAKVLCRDELASKTVLVTDLLVNQCANRLEGTKQSEAQSAVSGIVASLLG
ncbi:lytic transglycosylase domain-containing protein [Nocardioides donggukensis]|uniref:Lytic transglycosylase domain-containing protein n=1 Tax=Nocardioides donggukensis TaxID=2774019 RepID=A0A927Q2Y1_9ACTN|nr:lytic murein transglycosylase [Nocardioides donggukensis]MBD8870824.1 lytic transglycosylase domain-containing protein [Nocardioides donggukensis]